MVAWLDFAEDKYKGSASSAYGGLGMALGNNGFNIIGAMSLGQFHLGFVIFGIITFVGVLVATLIVHEPSNLNEKEDTSQKKEHDALSMSTLRQVLPAWHSARDYYLALIGKILLGVYNVGNSLPQAVGPVIAAAAIGLIGFSGVFIISLVSALVASLCIFAIRSVFR